MESDSLVVKENKNVAQKLNFFLVNVILIVFGGIGVRSSWIYMSSIYDFRRFLEQCTRFFDFCTTRVFDEIAENRRVLAKIDKIGRIFYIFRAEDLFYVNFEMVEIFSNFLGFVVEK